MSNTEEDIAILNSEISMGLVLSGSFQELSQLNSKLDDLTRKHHCRIVYRTRSAAKLYIKEGRS